MSGRIDHICGAAKGSLLAFSDKIFGVFDQAEMWLGQNALYSPVGLPNRRRSTKMWICRVSAIR